DRSQPRADGRACTRHRVRRAGLARARDELRQCAGRAHAAERMTTTYSWSPRPVLRAALALLLALGAIAGGYVLLDVPLRSIEMEAPFQRVTAMQIEAAMRGALTGGFLSVDLDQVQRALEALPWV